MKIGCEIFKISDSVPKTMLSFDASTFGNPNFLPFFFFWGEVVLLNLEFMNNFRLMQGSNFIKT